MSVTNRHPAHCARDERGFTLIETLVAMIAGIVVTGALFEIFIVSLHQSSRITDSVQATQLGRTAMTHVIDELHSACIARSYTPVQEKSNENELIFRNAYSEEATIPNVKEAEEKSKKGTGAYQHQIVWNKEKSTLTDFIYPSESTSAWPKFTFPTPDYSSSTREAANAEPKKGILLASNVSQTETGSSKNPIFRYYKYGETYSSGSGEPVSTLTEITPPTGGFTEAEANTVAAVLVSFKTAPIDNYTALSRSAEFSNQVTFSFGTPSSETKISDKPCQ
jgi:type II secretory pathway pseudopilin PulG